jgi:hypothetical protein
MSAWSPLAVRGRHLVVADKDRPANLGRSTPEAEAQLPVDAPILREPFTVENLRRTVAAMIGEPPEHTRPRGA